jgi:hypothetical protein
LITENLSTLKIHKLTQEQYDREREAGRLDANALYLTPDEEADLSGYIIAEDGESLLIGDSDSNRAGTKGFRIVKAQRET